MYLHTALYVVSNQIHEAVKVT